MAHSRYCSQLLAYFTKWAELRLCAVISRVVAMIVASAGGVYMRFENKILSNLLFEVLVQRLSAAAVNPLVSYDSQEKFMLCF